MNRFKQYIDSFNFGRSLIDYVYEGTHKRQLIKGYVPHETSDVAVALRENLRSMLDSTQSNDLGLSGLLLIGAGIWSKPYQTIYFLSKLDREKKEPLQ